MSRHPRAARAILALLALLALASPSTGYSVLTHEQVVDIQWKDQIVPLLLKRFPGATEEDVRKAHAYAYGGCVMQDMGYYPFGSNQFSDLVHYVRSGDFVVALIREAQDVNEYAFALGALAHYSSDNTGHPTINHVVALSFPKLRARYGEQVTYADNPKAHIQTEFGFDVVQVEKNRYASDDYKDFIGFEVSKPVLERAFLATYDMKLDDVVGHLDLAIGSFRRAVSTVIPEMTRVAMRTRHAERVTDTANAGQRKFLYNLSRAEYEKEWGTVYKKPGLFTRILAFIIGWIPKIGPLKILAFKIPTAETEDLYIKSVNKTVENYSALLRQVNEEGFSLPNINCDTAKEPRTGEYAPSDDAVEKLLAKLAEKDLKQVSPALRENILAFYAKLDVSKLTKKERKRLRPTLEQLEKLRAVSN